MKLLERRVVRQFVKFGVIGGLSFLIDCGLYLVFTRQLHVFYLTAKVASFSVAATNSFVWNRRWTFRSRSPNRVRQGGQFLLVASTGAALNAGIMYVLHGVSGFDDLLALVVATGIVMFWNFLANRHWTFRDTLA